MLSDVNDRFIPSSPNDAELHNPAGGRSRLLIGIGALTYSLAALVPWHTGVSLLRGSCESSASSGATGGGADVVGNCSVATIGHLSSPVDHGSGLFSYIGVLTIAVMLVIAFFALRRRGDVGRGLAIGVMAGSGLVLAYAMTNWANRSGAPQMGGAESMTVSIIEPFGLTNAVYIAFTATVVVFAAALGALLLRRSTQPV